MRTTKVSLLALILASVATSATAKPISSGGGKYSTCKASYDKCMESVFGSPGSQSHNVGKAKCYKAWKGCVGMGTMALGTGNPASDIVAIQEFEVQFLASTESEAAPSEADGEDESEGSSLADEAIDSVWE